MSAISARAAARRDLRIDDLAHLVDALRVADRPPRIFRAVEALSAAVIGHRLFTIMRFDAERAEIERVHTTQPAVYPVGGRKSKKDTAWSDHTLRDMKIFRTSDPEAIRAAFDDHPTIASLGLGSVLNFPLVLSGRCVGTMNLLHEAGWYTAQDEATGLLLGAFLLPPLVHRPIA
jgi:GAF domain-containing protein